MSSPLPFELNTAIQSGVLPWTLIGSTAAPLFSRIRGLERSLLTREVQGREVVGVGRVGIRSVREQLVHANDVVLERRVVQRHATCLVHADHFGSSNLWLMFLTMDLRSSSGWRCSRTR